MQGIISPEYGIKTGEKGDGVILSRKIFCTVEPNAETRESQRQEFVQAFVDLLTGGDPVGYYNRIERSKAAADKEK